MNECTAFSFFVDRGLRDFQAAAVVGNLIQESGLNTRAVGDAGISHGIAQWNGQRWQNAVTLAAMTGKDVYDLQFQLDFVWRELPANGLGQLQASTSLEQAVTAFQNLFERCGQCNTSARVASARATLAGCAGISPPAEPATPGWGFAIATGLLALGASYAALRMARR